MNKRRLSYTEQKQCTVPVHKICDTPITFIFYIYFHKERLNPNSEKLIKLRMEILNVSKKQDFYIASTRQYT